MRIAYIIARGDAFGGSSLHVCDMAYRLTSDGHTVRIFVGGQPDMEVPRRFAERDLDFVCIPHMGRAVHPLKDWRALVGLRREIVNFGPHLVSAHSSKAGALGRLACLRLGIPILYTPHCWSFTDGFPNARPYLFIERTLAPLATRIITVCQQERDHGLLKGVGRDDQTLCIHNGVVDNNEYTPRADLDLAESPNILMVGRFEAQKDQDLLLRALADNVDLDWTLTLVGDGPRKGECETLARDLGISSRVEFVGYSSRVEEHLRRADVVAMITHWEAFPRSVLEAMRAGLPVIVSDVGGCREAIVEGETGRIIARGDRLALARVLRELISDHQLRKNMGARARDLYLSRFTFEIMYQKYLELYQAVCSS